MRTTLLQAGLLVILLIKWTDMRCYYEMLYVQSPHHLGSTRWHVQRLGSDSAKTKSGAQVSCANVSRMPWREDRISVPGKTPKHYTSKSPLQNTIAIWWRRPLAARCKCGRRVSP